MKTYIKPVTIVIKMDELPLLAGSGGSSGGGGGGGAKRYAATLDDASPVGLSLNEDDDNDNKKWY